MQRDTVDYDCLSVYVQVYLCMFAIALLNTVAVVASYLVPLTVTLMLIVVKR